MAPPAADGESTIAFESEPEALGEVVEEITGFVAEQVAETHRAGVVVEISGRLNSAVATMLAVDALGADRVFGLLLPTYMGTEADALTAELVAKGLGIEFARVQLLPFVHLFSDLPVPGVERPPDVRATENAIDRMRMACAFYTGDTMDRLVLGTENRTEWLLGTVTKYGVRRGDILPLGDLYQTEVRNLADHIGIPDGVCESPEDWARPSFGPTVDVDRATIDVILHHLVDEDGEIDQTAEELGVDVEVVRALAKRHSESRHQRTLPPTPQTATADRYDSFHEIELRFD